MPNGVLKGISEEIGKTVDEAKKQIAPDKIIEQGVEQLTGKKPTGQTKTGKKIAEEEGLTPEQLKEKEAQRQKQMAYWRKVLEDQQRVRQQGEEQVALRQKKEQQIRTKKAEEKKIKAPYTPISFSQGPGIVRGPTGRPQRGIPAAIERKKKGQEIKGGRF